MSSLFPRVLHTVLAQMDQPRRSVGGLVDRLATPSQVLSNILSGTGAHKYRPAFQSLQEHTLAGPLQGPCTPSFLVWG